MKTSIIPLSDQKRQSLENMLKAILAVCGLTCLTMLIPVIGWPLSDKVRLLIDLGTGIILKIFIVVMLFRLLIQTHLWDFILSHRLEVFLTLTLILEALAGDNVIAWLGAYTPDVSAATMTLVFLALNQVVLTSVVGLRVLRHAPLLQSRRLSPGQVFILSFAVLILVGTLLLKTPHATHAGIQWIDALFISTSAVCVTGLSSVDVASTFTSHGQWILLGLIQVGGLGIMTLTYFFAYFLSRDMNLRSRVGLQDLLSEDHLGQIGTALALIIGFTALVEISGALLIHASLSDHPSRPDNLAFFSLFHAVSAFCNAGFSTLSPNLSDAAVAGKTGFLSIIMALIVIGGLGFPVVKSLWQWIISRVRYRLKLTATLPTHFSVNSRLVLTTTALLLALGTASLWITEFLHGHGPSNGNTFVTALFHSVTARTAGFNITPMSGLQPASAIILMLLMFAGGSPSSTAGGIKTTTLAVAFLSLKRVILGRTEIEAFKRRFSDELANRALAIILVAAGFLSIVTVSLCMLHPELPPFDLLFEAVSALGTVGLSRDLTPKLSAPAKTALIAAMFIGRVGVLTFVTSFMRRPTPPAFRYPETSIVIN